MAVLYCRMTKLTNVVGRKSYISDPQRQENLEAFHDTMELKDWVALGSENRAQFNGMKQKGIMAGLKNSKGGDAECIEARELVIHMPHGMALKNQDEVARQLANLINKEYGVDCCVAIHWNKAKSNYHAHVIFSEKIRLKEPMRATRNMYYDSNWKRCKKSEAVNIVKKGDIIRNFESTKLRKFKSHDFLEKELKPLLAKEVKLEVYKNDGIHLTFQKVGKTPEPLRTRIIEANENVREWNQAMDILLENGVSKAELERFRRICYDVSKKEWRNELVDGMKKLNQHYCVNENSFIELWSMYEERQLELEKLRQKKVDLSWSQKEKQKEIDYERSFSFFSRNRKKIKQLETAQKRTETRINQLEGIITNLPNWLENARNKLRRSRPRFMNVVECYYGFNILPNYRTAKDYYELQKLEKIRRERENESNRTIDSNLKIKNHEHEHERSIER